MSAERDNDAFRAELEAIGKRNVDAILDAANRGTSEERERIFAAMRAEPPAFQIVDHYTCDCCGRTLTPDDNAYMTTNGFAVVARHCEACGPPWEPA